jgi:hypothetical protein
MTHMAMTGIGDWISYREQIIKLLRTKHSRRTEKACEVAIENDQLIHDAFRARVEPEDVADDLDERSRRSVGHFPPR